MGGISFTPAFVAPILGRLSKRFEDRRILLAGTLAQLVGSALVFDYNSPVTYLIGSFILFNGYTAEVIFMSLVGVDKNGKDYSNQPNQI